VSRPGDEWKNPAFHVLLWRWCSQIADPLQFDGRTHTISGHGLPTPSSYPTHARPSLYEWDSVWSMLPDSLSSSRSLPTSSSYPRPAKHKPSYPCPAKPTRAHSILTLPIGTDLTATPCILQ